MVKDNGGRRRSKQGISKVLLMLDVYHVQEAV